MEAAELTLEMRGVVKQFNRVPVLKKAHFSLRKGEVHALMGGNGAGKSTMMKILTGVYLADAGEILINGKAVDIGSPNAAQLLGVAMIFQEFSLVPTLTVAQNIFLNREPRLANRMLIDDLAMTTQARTILRTLGEDIDPSSLVRDLSVGMCQIVEIAKALSKNAHILIMDEPTSSISENEVERLFDLVRKLKSQGISIIYISHRMPEVFSLCDRVTVMRDGEIVLTDDCSNLTMRSLIEAMLGSETSATMQWLSRNHDLGKLPAIEIKNLSRDRYFSNVNLQVFPGEIVGLAGLMGSGRTEILETIFGLYKPTHGEILIQGKSIQGQLQAIRAGVALVPESRRKQGLVLSHSVINNFLITNLSLFRLWSFVHLEKALNSVKQFISLLNIKTDQPFKTVGLLSGGNQQKVVLAKWLSGKPTILLLDEPTIGVDIGAKSDILDLVRKLASEGAAILVVSSELEELLAMSDRVVVLQKGYIKNVLNRQQIESEEDLHHAVQSF